MEQIIIKAASQLTGEADAANMEDDWIMNFFDKARIVSDEEMQNLWAGVLAGEANRPGSYSKRTVNMLGDLDQRDAKAFLALCRFGWQVNGFTPLVFDVKAPIYNKNGINFEVLTHLDSIGLIKFEPLTGFIRVGLPRTFTVSYGGRHLTLQMPKDADNELELGSVLLTQTGKELARICDAPKVDGYEEYVREVWKKHLPPPPKAEHVGSASPHPGAG